MLTSPRGSARSTVVIDGRELARQHSMTLRMVENGELEDGERCWLPDRRPPNRLEWNWLGQATSGEHLFWTPTPAVEG